jgi:inorganic pyrophosphatase
VAGMKKEVKQLMAHLFRAHPWHGIPIGEKAPELVNAYLEMLPTDTLKYELDKATGIMRVDRPQRFSSVCPQPYGFVPQTLCAERVAEFCRSRTGRKNIKGDDDPLDILVLTESHVSHVDIFLRVIPIGGLRMLDGDEADDKIVAILEGDSSYGYWRDISQCPSLMVERLRHYFLTYKQSPGAMHQACEITHIYGAEEAQEVIRRSHEDYIEQFGDFTKQLNEFFESIGIIATRQ